MLSITAYSDDGEEERDAFIGDITEKYLRKFASMPGADKTFEMLYKNGNSLGTRKQK